MHRFCIYLDWGGMTPEAWAAWSQAALAAAAVALAIFVPVRMQRLAELERMLTPLEVFEALLARGELYLAKLKSSSNTAQLDFYEDEYIALLEAARRSLEHAGLPPSMITELAVAIRFATIIGREWKAQMESVAFIRADNPHLLGAAERRVAKVDTCLRRSAEAVRSWKDRHRVALCFTAPAILSRIERLPTDGHAANL